jgi:putative ABC transport system ATP-binding protein
MSEAAAPEHGGAPRPDVVTARAVVRTFHRAGEDVHALRGVDLTVPSGVMVALHGRSGSGKTTLLNVIGGLDTATSGHVVVCGLDLGAANERTRVALRRHEIAFVFQAFGLLPVLSAAENVEVPLRLHGVPPGVRSTRVDQLLDLVGLRHRGHHRPAELSGGEQQRVAIARALANEPRLLIADEPTGQLDSGTGRRMMDLLRGLVDERGLSILVATHDPTLLEDADVVHELHDGRLRSGTITPRFDGDIDRTRTLQESTTLPRARADEHAAYRREGDADVVPPRPSLPTGLVGAAARLTDGEDDDADWGEGEVERRAPRFGPDGELLED